jgi:hypothetical protein
LVETAARFRIGFLRGIDKFITSLARAAVRPLSQPLENAATRAQTRSLRWYLALR